MADPIQEALCKSNDVYISNRDKGTTIGITALHNSTYFEFVTF